jgi:DNA-binding MarR family transcriptional regulator
MTDGREKRRRDHQPHRNTPLPEDGYAPRIFNATWRIARAIDIGSQSLVAQHQVTSTQLLCLTAIGADHKTATTTAIAKRVHLSPSTIVGVLDRLEAKGLVERRRSRRDRRVVHISATDAGRALVAEASHPLRDAFAKALGQMSEQNQEQTTICIERLVDLLWPRGSLRPAGS